MTRRLIATCLFLSLLAGTAAGQEGENTPSGTPDGFSVSSRVERTAVGERVLIQEVLLNASITDVWQAYTTDEGWMSWAAPKARVDLRAGGTILTQYEPNAEIGDPGTNTLHIINYVPQRLLTLKAELNANWPEVMKQDGERLNNVILFERVSDSQTRIESYGVGYGDSPEYEQLIEFFISANEGLFAELARALAR